MQRDMAPIEGKNNALDIEWRNYRNLHDHIGMLVESVSLMPEQVCVRYSLLQH
jgi:hypothetical protein